jgi:hypothetical protein
MRNLIRVPIPRVSAGRRRAHVSGVCRTVKRAAGEALGVLGMCVTWVCGLASRQPLRMVPTLRYRVQTESVGVTRGSRQRGGSARPWEDRSNRLHAMFAFLKARGLECPGTGRMIPATCSYHHRSRRTEHIGSAGDDMGERK